MERIAGLDAIAHGDPAAPRVLVLVHGRDMTAADLAPFAESLRLADTYVVCPEAPDASPRGGKTWWAMDAESRAPGVRADDARDAGDGIREVRDAREARDLRGDVGDGIRDVRSARDRRGDLGGEIRVGGEIRDARDVADDARVDRPLGHDLAARTFPGREPARARFAAFLRAFAGRELAVAGFSQGGMLAMDALLLEDPAPPIRTLALLSSSRIDIGAWTARADRLHDVPILVAHGRADAELAFSAGEGLRDFATAAGARVTWLPFDGAHEIPLVVWRGLKRFLTRGGF